MSAIVLIGHGNLASAAMELAMKKNRRNTVANKHGRDVKSLRSRSSLRPLEHMLKVINDDKFPLELRSQMAAAALPYMHHKLPAITLDDIDPPEEPSLNLSKLTTEEIEQLRRILAKSDTRR
jgi:hypothetical protein